MDALMFVGGLGLLGGLSSTGWAIMTWYDPKAADRLAARLRGRAVELRMLAAARQEAQAQARQIEEGCLRDWKVASDTPTTEAEDHA